MNISTNFKSYFLRYFNKIILKDITITTMTVLIILNNNLNICNNRNDFPNQISFKLKITDKKSIILKIFNNGTILIIGCSNLDELNYTIKYIIQKFKNNYIKDIKIVMINSKGGLIFKIEKEKLFKLLLNKNILCKYEPSIHNSLHIFLNKCNMLVLSKTILINNCKTYIDILYNYIYLNKLLLMNYDEVLSKNIIQIY